MVHNDWVWVWVQIVANGVVGAVANGSQRLGLGLGSDRREWCCRTIANGFAGAVMHGSQRLGLGLGSDRREWLSATVWE